MPDREFIHAREDVTEALLYAQTLGLQVLPDVSRSSQPQEPLSADDIVSQEQGVFQLFLPEWVADPLQFMLIEAGANAGKYVVQQGVNFAPITIDFHKENNQSGRRRLGSGSISFKREWLHKRAHEMRPSPPEISRVYDALCKHLFSKTVIKAGVHRYVLCRHALQVASSENTIPPFDFIPWPPPKSPSGKS
jgi:hypothetical protein